jgi:UDP-glucose 4-epimerase
MGITVAVTGPTGEIGISAVNALEQEPSVDRILGMARSPFDPTTHGWTKTEYRQGDILDADAVRDLVEQADVVVHLAYLIMGSREESRRINLTGTRNVFEATVRADRPRRLVYTSSVAAYGYHADNPQPLTEDVPTRGSAEHYYSAHKAELEATLADALAGSDTEAMVFRPCIVAGPESPTLIEMLTVPRLAGRLPAAVRRVYEQMPMLRPVIPDPGVPLQLVHADDVARALVAGVLAHGPAGAYNLAASEPISISDVADALGWYSVPLPELLVDASSELVNRLPFLPAEASWINAMRVPVLMDCSRARRELGWEPRHDARETLAATVAGARGEMLPDA